MKTKSALYCLLLLIAASLFTATVKAQVNVNDSLALVDLYNSTNGPVWTYDDNWLTAAPVSTWYGVTVTDNRVTGLYLYSDELYGSLPASIGNLVKLTGLILGANYLSDAIPSSIGNLVNLATIDLSYNRLSGTIPTSIGNLVNLDFLNLSANRLSGTIPAEIGNCTNLTELWLYSNQLSTIPAEIGNLKKLEILRLSYNQLSTIPAEIGNCTNLTSLYLNNNQLSGAIPTSIGNLVKLTNLLLQNNQLSGVIPPEIGNCTNLTSLYLNNNQLSGAIPASFRNFKYLSYIDLSYNQLSEDRNVKFSTDINEYMPGSIGHNLFTFNGLEFIAKKYLRITYTPQAILPLHQNGNTLSVYAGGTLSNNTYHWSKVGATDSTIVKADSTFTPQQSGKYYVTVKNKVATKLTLYSDTIDFTLSPLKQSSNTLIAKRVQPATIIQHMRVYPNPTKDMVHVQINGTAMIAITNADGKVLLTKSINNSDVINVSSFAPGIYYLQNKTSGEVQKIIIH